MFIDEATIWVKGGDGGNGCVSFRREKYVPKGGPDGGDGGKGGDVVFVVDGNMTTLLDFKYRTRYEAGRGSHGMGKKMKGESGEDLFIPVPLGTVVIDAGTGKLLGDLTEAGQTLVAARGGKGGMGNANFASPTLRAPRKATPGAEGEERKILLQLKLLADVGLVGKPNVGKSTLLSRISRARPKIADYPFTTKVPNLGLVRGKGLDFVVADIPGLIEGAHTGKGMGVRFLKHIERTKVILMLVEATSSDPVGDYRVLLEELRSHSGSLLARPRCLVFTKADLLTSQLKLRDRSFEDVFTLCVISAVTGEGVSMLMEKVEEKLRELSAIEGGEDERE